jgi:hypothetical protein
MRDRGIIVTDEDGLVDPELADAQVRAHLGMDYRLDGAAPANGSKPKRAYPEGVQGKTGRPPKGTPKPDYAQHRAELERLKVERLRRELEAEKGEMMSRESVCREWASAGRVVRDGLLSFPDRLTIELANALGTDARAEARDVIEREVRALLHSMADEIDGLAEEDSHD